MAGYDDTRQLIIDTLMGRPAGTEIQPEDHQAFALAIIDYVRSVELLAGNAFIGFAEADTIPVQSDKGQCFYISIVKPGQTVNFVNFIDYNGDAISISSPSNKISLVTLIWNTEYWSSQIVTLDAITTGSASWGDIVGDIDDQTDLQQALSGKQDTLTAGSNITIVDNVISATGGGGGGGANWGEIGGTLSNQADLATALAGKADESHTHTQSEVTGLTAALAGKQNTLTAGSNIMIVNDVISATGGGGGGGANWGEIGGTLSNQTDLAAALSGKASISHTHQQSDIDGLSTALGGKANIVHSHAVSDVTNLQSELDGKQAKQTFTANTSTPSDGDFVLMQSSSETGTTAILKRTISKVWDYIKGKADLVYATISHSHAISDITNLQTTLNNKQSTLTFDDAPTAGSSNPVKSSGIKSALDGKANSSHSHSQSDVDGLTTALAGKANSTHSHAISDVTNLQSALDGKQSVLTFDDSPTAGSSNPVKSSGIKTALDGKQNSITAGRGINISQQSEISTPQAVLKNEVFISYTPSVVAGKYKEPYYHRILSIPKSNFSLTLNMFGNTMGHPFTNTVRICSTAYDYTVSTLSKFGFILAIDNTNNLIYLCDTDLKGHSSSPTRMTNYQVVQYTGSDSISWEDGILDTTDLVVVTERYIKTDPYIPKETALYLTAVDEDSYYRITPGDITDVVDVVVNMGNYQGDGDVILFLENQTLELGKTYRFVFSKEIPAEQLFFEEIIGSTSEWHTETLGVIPNKIRAGSVLSITPISTLFEEEGDWLISIENQATNYINLAIETKGDNEHWNVDKEPDFNLITDSHAKVFEAISNASVVEIMFKQKSSGDFYEASLASLLSPGEYLGKTLTIKCSSKLSFTDIIGAYWYDGSAYYQPLTRGENVLVFSDEEGQLSSYTVYATDMGWAVAGNSLSPISKEILFSGRVEMNGNLVNSRERIGSLYYNTRALRYARVCSYSTSDMNDIGLLAVLDNTITDYQISSNFHSILEGLRVADLPRAMKSIFGTNLGASRIADVFTFVFRVSPPHAYIWVSPTSLYYEQGMREILEMITNVEENLIISNVYEAGLDKSPVINIIGFNDNMQSDENWKYGVLENMSWGGFVDSRFTTLDMRVRFHFTIGGEDKIYVLNMSYDDTLTENSKITLSSVDMTDWYGTQAEYNALASITEGRNYYIINS